MIELAIEQLSNFQFWQFSIISNYLFENNNPTTNSNFAVGMESKEDYFLKTECYYLIQFEQVYGTLILKKDCLVFEPSRDVDKNRSLIRQSCMSDL